MATLVPFDPQSFAEQFKQFSVGVIDLSVQLMQMQGEKAELEAWHAERTKGDRDREALIREFRTLHQEGHSLWHHHTAQKMKAWEKRTSKLIEMALGTEKRREFCREDPGYPEWEWNKEKIPENATEEQIRMIDLLERLIDLTKQVNSHTLRLNLFSEFDIQKYHQWLSGQ